MSNSQEQQDKFVIEYFNGMMNGYFVDIGAYDGLEFSNTYKLETRYEWKGILVECDPAVLEKLKNKRKCPIETRALWSKSDEEVVFKSFDSGKLSGIENKLTHKKTRERPGSIHTLKTISLNDLLVKYNSPKHINYMSMDIEGAEYEVLSAFDFSYTFDIMSIEHMSNKNEIIELIVSKGYKVAKEVLLGNETIFVRA